MNRYFAAVAPLVLLTASGCAAPFQANVSRFQQLPAPQGQTFAVVADDPRLAGGLEFSQYAGIVADRLSRQGYVRANAPGDATLLVQVGYAVDRGREKLRSVPGFASPRFGYGYLSNVRIHMGDALDVLQRLPDASLDRAYLLHPDPWPKVRHAKRRFMNAGQIALVAAKLKSGGELRFGTDHPVYVAHAMAVMQQRPEFTWQASCADDFLERPTDWPETRYERKARRLGHEVWYMRYRRQ